MIATDIISESFEKTKELYFPIRIGYWVRMGIISMFGGTTASSFSNSYNSSSGRNSAPSDINVRELLSKFNTEALKILSQYGIFIAIGFFILYLIGLFFSYINSVFMFMFIDGIVQKDIRILKSFGKNQKQGISLFALRFIVGLFSMIMMILIFSPLIMAFFSHDLSTFNYWLLIPMILVFILFSLIMGIFWFLVYDLVTPIMYLKDKAFWPAWTHFLKIAKSKKLEIFVYWVMQIVLSILISLISILLFIPLLIVLILFILFGILIYSASNAVFGTIPAIMITVLYALAVIFIFVVGTSILFVPLTSFPRVYSIEMVKKLDSI